MTPLAAQPGALIERIEGRLAAARSALENGGDASLEGLEQDVASLRDLVSELPPGSGKTLRPRLLALLEEIDRLGEELRRGLDRVGRELGQTGKRRAAVSAYARSQGAKPKDRR